MLPRPVSVPDVLTFTSCDAVGSSDLLYSLHTIQIQHTNFPHAGDKLEPLYAPIRHKLGNALTSWHPSDGSAKIILAPWVGVFRQGHMDAFLVKNVLPKLGQVLEEMPITPHQQSLGERHKRFWAALQFLCSCVFCCFLGVLFVFLSFFFHSINEICPQDLSFPLRILNALPVGVWMCVRLCAIVVYVK